MTNWNIDEEPYPGPSYLPSPFEYFKNKYFISGRMIGKNYEFKYFDEVFTASPPTVEWSSAAADPLKDVRDAMKRIGMSDKEATDRMAELIQGFNNLPKYEITDGKKKPRTHGPRIDFGFDRRGRKIR